MVFRPGDRIAVQSDAQGERLMALSGETLTGPRFIWWNFVSSSRERLEGAKRAWRTADWDNGTFRPPQGHDAEFIPAPKR
jgi:redox-sensitive bicupin YhaK (pirin superfamily)